MDPIASQILRCDGGARRRRRRRRLRGFGGRRDDALVEEPFEIRGIIRVRDRGAREERHRSGDREAARAHSYTRMILRTSARKAIPCLRAWVRFTRSFGRPDTRSNPRTMPRGVSLATAETLSTSM